MPIAYVGIGSNIDRERHVRSGLLALWERFGPMVVSSVYDAPAIGFAGGDFFNLVVAFRSREGLDVIASALRSIEQAHGRLREASKFSSRTLDLDLLMYGATVRDGPEPRLPRADITRYAFVLAPLAEIAPELEHPVLRVTMADLWRDFGSADDQVRPIEFDLEPILRPDVPT